MNIQLNQIRKNYGKEDLLDIRNYYFKTDTIHGIIGDNGSGKTTLLRMISGLDRHYYGEISYNDSLYNERLIKEMTYIGQKPYMLKGSVLENIAYPLKIRGYSKNEINNKVNLYLNKLEIEYLKNQAAEVLSAGERQKVAMARALIFEPKLLILDEPTANIDPDTVEFLEELLIDFRRRCKSNIIIVTHNIDQAVRVCDRVSILKNRNLKECSQDFLLKIIKKKEEMDLYTAMNYKRLGV